MSDHPNNSLSDRELIEQANLRPLYETAANIQLAALKSLKAIAAECGVPLDRITREDVIRTFSQEQAKSESVRKYLDGLSGKTGQS